MSMLACGVLASHAGASPEGGVAADVDSLAAASYFATGPTGVGGVEPPMLALMQRLHREPSARELMGQAFARGSLEARLYVACWAESYAREDYPRYKATLLAADGQASTMTGSVLRKEATAEVLARIDKGGCGRLLVGAS
ncbi:MAG TPA: hypothetical protein VFV25_01505 [Methylibium sp.]